MIDADAVPGWIQPSVAARRRILDTSHTIAVLGASANTARASNFVLAYLLGSSDYRLYPVNPNNTEILGLRCYRDLESLPVVADIVVVFRRNEDLDAVATEAIGARCGVFWTQLGLWSASAAQSATAAGLEVVMNRCIKIEHARFHGGLHLAGFDTGVVDSRRR